MEKEPIDIYLLFGESACKAFAERRNVEDVNRKVHFGALYHWNSEKNHPVELLGAYDGWNDYEVLTKEEYDQLTKKFNN